MLRICTLTQDSREDAKTMLPEAVSFHGHLGPYLVLGMRMGLLARSFLKPKNQDDLKAVIEVRLAPPVSCVVDGVQVASGCTLGKGTIQLSEVSDRILAKFQGHNGMCTIRVKSQVFDELLEGTSKGTDEDIRRMAEDVMTRSDSDLFEIVPTL